MAVFSEAIVVRISGDSSELLRALDGARRDVAAFRQEFERSGAGVLKVMERLAGAVGGVGRTIAAMPSLRIDVRPALAGLAAVAGMLDSLAARAAGVALAGVGATAARALGTVTAAAKTPIRKFAAGGNVAAGGDEDRVPALLAPGEFVLNRRAVERIGLPLLEAVNTLGGAAVAPGPVRSGPVTNDHRVINHVGGITLNVREAADVDRVLRDLRFRGFTARMRKG